MELTGNAKRLLRQRYLKPGEDWYNLVRRVVRNIAPHESPEFRADIFDILHERIALPNSPALVNAGTQTGGLMACFVAGPTEDNLENHFDTLKEIGMVAKRGGGCGFTGTFIRPAGSPVAGSTHGYAYGPLKYAIRVNNFMSMMTQGDDFRKMALMFTLRSDHEDIADFIRMKQVKDEEFASLFNQSVMATDEFMSKALGNHGRERELLEEIAYSAWNNGEPGLLFYDRINEETPYAPLPETIEATNPCGEQPLPAYGSCNLGSINLAHNIFFDDSGHYDFSALGDVARKMTRFLDDIGSANIFPSKKFEDWYNSHRPVGLGVMGFADALLEMGIRYGSRESLRFLSHALDIIQWAANQESEKLGRERGVPSNCGHVGRRNITLTSIAPTGSIAILAGCSHSIEPVLAAQYLRTDERGESYLFSHPKRYERFFVSSLNENPDKMPTWVEHVDVQAEAQKYVDSAVSKTINFPHDATAEDVLKAMTRAYNRGCKGITVYRDGSREKQVLTEVKEGKESEISCPTGVCEI